MIEPDPITEYPHSCPKCNDNNASSQRHGEDDWMWQTWYCDSCEFSWTEHYEFSYWEQTES